MTLKKSGKITDRADMLCKAEKNLNSMGDEVFAVLLGHTITQNHTQQLMDAYDTYDTSVVSLKTATSYDAGRHKIISADNVEDNNYQIR